MMENWKICDRNDRIRPPQHLNYQTVNSVGRGEADQCGGTEEFHTEKTSNPGNLEVFGSLNRHVAGRGISYRHSA